ncbi:MAG TPA: efflux RND transporter periplasmic adaptor subunit [Chthoniobacterales bacterium]|nr:efflux RND transporter periplasmic adaptor subunit [Chthoniobacterales bacterium]
MHRNSRRMIGQRLSILAIFVAALLVVLLFDAGCSRKAPQAGPAAPEVQVTTVQPRDVPRVLERVATLDGFINANINAQVQGYIVSRDYKEGSIVKKGDLLFQIDPRPFEAALAQAKGTEAKDQANWAKADADQKRAVDLFNKKVISDQERDTATAAAGSSKANVEADEAAVKQAEINLGYTKITAPIDGVVGFANNQVGDLVGPSTGPLTTMSQVDPIKANVTAGESAFTDFFSRYPDATQREALLKSIDFDLILGDGKVYPHKGKFYALDRNLDPKTGSIHYYVTFPNPDATLRPGQYGKVRFIPDTVQNALVVPQEAVTELQGNFQVAVVDQNKVSIRPVKTGEKIGAMLQITDGLKPGDKVVVEGVQKAREGSTVTVKEWTPPANQVASDSSPAQKNP